MRDPNETLMSRVETLAGRLSEQVEAGLESPEEVAHLADRIGGLAMEMGAEDGGDVEDDDLDLDDVGDDPFDDEDDDDAFDPA